MASCAVDVAPVRAEPDDAAEQVTQVLRDEPLRVEERRPGWARIVTAYDYPGWVRADVVGERAPEWPPPERDGEPLAEARRYLGSPYEWGGLTERGIDCSGLVHMAYRRLGRIVPRDAHQQEAAATPVDESDARPGDLVCFGEAGNAHHVAFWLGDGRILHATSREGANGVVEEPLASVGDHRVRFVRLARR
jgi:cell wall-associated NlpC family hydrolase